MKKIHIVLAVLATAALTSCQEEKSFNGVPMGKGDVAFVLKAGPSTRAADIGSPSTSGVNVPIGRVGNMNLYLEETVSDLDCFIPETRGVPVFTENVGKLFADNLFVHAVGGGFGDAVFGTDGIAGEGWRYSHHYGDKDPWPETEEVDFYLRIPSDMTGATFNSDSYAAGAKTIFTYTSPATAEGQEDIIFTGATLDKGTHDTYLPNGYPVTFYHALTAVKFAIANPEDEVENIQVNSITFTGLKNTGTCTVNPNATGTDTDPFVAWTNTSATNTSEQQDGETVTKPNVISQAFEAGDLVEFNSTKNPDFGDSFFTPSKPETDKQNINTQNASKTFWLVPQTFNGSSAVLRISYTMNGNDEYIDLKLGEVLANVEWKAGQLRTYTIRMDEVNVLIDDTVAMEEKTTETVTTPWGDRDFDSYYGSKKENVIIKNTGNTDAFIRAAIIGQWRDVDGNPVFGYTDFTEGIQLVDSWYMDVIVNKTCYQGEFEGLPGNNWVEDDGYYYYTKVVPAGSQIPATDALFASYTVGHVPGAAVAGVPQQIYFTLEIATQAISAKKMDGTTWKDSDYATVWQNAINQK